MEESVKKAADQEDGDAKKEAASEPKDAEKQARRAHEESYTLKVKAEFIRPACDPGVAAADASRGDKPPETAKVAATLQHDGGEEKKEPEMAAGEDTAKETTAALETVQKTTTQETAAPRDERGSGRLSSKERKERRGMNKKRPRDVKPADGDKMCIAVIRGETCPYGDACKYSHDLRLALEKRPPDIPQLLDHFGVCPIYASKGYCTYGIMCRMGSTHCNMSTGVNLRAATTDGEDDAPQEENDVTNIVSREVRDSLRKRQYEFKIAPPHQPNRGGGGGGKRNNKRDRRGRGGRDNDTANRSEEKEKVQDAPSAKKEKLADESAETSEKGKVAEESETKSEPTSKEGDAKIAAEDVKAVETSATSAPAGDVEMKEAGPATASTDVATKPQPQPMDMSPLPTKERKLIDFRNKVYVAPLTTVGNLPFRRILKRYGADITCSEMALVPSLLEGKPSEWALLKRHASEDVFGIQIAAGFPDQFARISEVLESENVSCDFLDMNLGCPLDIVCDKGAGAALMLRDRKLKEALTGMSQILSCPMTVKIRTGWEEQRPIAHNLVPKIQSWQIPGLSAIFLHGRSRLQRYQKLANWDYIQQVANSQSDDIPKVPLIGNGDVFSYVDYEEKIARSGVSTTAMIGRGALVKPWLPTEIKERRHWDIAASERLDILKEFVRFGLEHWGSDQQGLNNTRRFLLEWLSFLYRYVPVGLLEVLPQQMNLRPPTNMVGRNDLETLMMSKHCDDWIKISEMLLGPIPEGFRFEPKHKANSYK